MLLGQVQFASDGTWQGGLAQAATVFVQGWKKGVWTPQCVCDLLHRESLLVSSACALFSPGQNSSLQSDEDRCHTISSNVRI